ncbi:MAG: hypothetical protein EU529_15840 [Promethearchaeota archaeon]|nr:MAG: hypothetical protein EU529_15840 [Candidatus Lokiarchaeota archaeon]
MKSHYCGICGSDITNFKYKMYQVPLIMGHELAGEVVEIGTNITKAKIGDRVACINVSQDVSGGQLRGLGIFQDGGFAEYVKVPQKFLFPIPKNISIRDAAMIESFANATRAMKLSKVEENQNIVIIGGGNLGLTFLKLLLIEKNPNYTVVVEPHEFLREKAKKIGATDAFPPSKVKIKKFIKKNGEPTFVFDCVGIEKTLIMAVELIKRGGTILLEGIQKGSILFPMFMINSKEINLKGCLGHDEQDILEAIDLFAKGKVDANEFISEIVSLKDIQKAFEKYLEPGERKFVKIIVKNF